MRIQRSWVLCVLKTPREYISALEHYRERLPSIEADVLGALEPKLREMVRQAGANAYLAQYLGAAVALGDVNFLDSDLSWLQGLLSAQSLPAEALRGYLSAYLAAVRKHLDRRGAIIVEWFQQALAEIAAMATV